MDMTFQSLKNRLAGGNRRAAAVLMALLIPGTLIAAKIHPKAGTTSAAFLKIAPGARAVSMGESFAGLADDATALYWNPAGIAQLGHKEFTLMHNESFQDLRFVFAGYVHPLSPRHAFGFSSSGLFVKSDLERRSGLGENISEDPLTESEGTFGAHDLAMAFSYARVLGDGSWLAGGTVKGIQQVIDGERAQGAAADLGLLWKIPHSRWQAAAAIQHAGPPIRFINKSYKLPLNGKLGVAWRPAAMLRLTADLNQSIDNYLKAGTGLEYDPLRFLSLRVGYKYRLNGNELGDLSGLTAGCGFRIRGYSVDYAFNPAGDLGNTHRVSLTARFGGEGSPPEGPAPSAGADEETIAEEEQQPEGPVPFRLSLKRLPKTKDVYRVEAEAQRPDDVYRLEFDAVLSSTGIPMNVSVMETDGEDMREDEDRGVYRLVTFRHDLPNPLRDVTVHFRVKKEWLRLRKVDAKDIRLIRIEGTRRIPKTVRITGENADFVSFTGIVGKEGPFILGVSR